MGWNSVINWNLAVKPLAASRHYDKLKFINRGLINSDILWYLNAADSGLLERDKPDSELLFAIGLWISDCANCGLSDGWMQKSQCVL